jgi:hypothetical protein
MISSDAVDLDEAARRAASPRKHAELKTRPARAEQS